MPRIPSSGAEGGAKADEPWKQVWGWTALMVTVSCELVLPTMAVLALALLFEGQGCGETLA